MSDHVRAGLLLAAFFAASAVSTAWLPLWFADAGVSAGQIGVLLGVSSLCRVAGVPGGGWLADRFGRRRAIMVAAMGAAGCAVALPGALGGASGGTGFWAVVAVMGGLGVCSALLAPLSDAVTLALAAARRLDYGRTRAWGSVSYMVATAGAGALLGWAGTGVVPALVAVGYGLAGVAAVVLRDVPADQARRAGGSLLGMPGFGAAVLGTALVQGSHAAYYGFAAVHWRGAGLGDTVIGLLIAEGIVAEVALFVWGRALVERLGPGRLTLLAAGCCVVRWTATAWTSELGALMVIQLLHAGTFALQHMSAMLVVRRVAPGRAALAQTVLAAVGFSLPMAVLSWLVGVAYGGWGGGVFLAMAGVGGLGVGAGVWLVRVERGVVV